MIATKGEHNLIDSESNSSYPTRLLMFNHHGFHYVFMMFSMVFDHFPAVFIKNCGFKTPTLEDTVVIPEAPLSEAGIRPGSVFLPRRKTGTVLCIEPIYSH